MNIMYLLRWTGRETRCRQGIYGFAEAMTGSVGWPLNLILTPQKSLFCRDLFPKTY